MAIASGVRDLELTLDDVLEDASNEMNHLARVTLQRAQAQWRELDAHLAWCDERIAAHGLGNDDVKRAGELMGVGPVGASAAIATVGDSSSSRAARSSAPGWGWCPGSIRRAGRPTWARFPKRGDTYLRTLLIQGAKSVVNTAHTRTDPISRWAFALKTRSVWQKAVVALANKNARILWGIMTKGTRFERNHKSEKPGPVAASASPPLACAQVAPAG